MSNFYKNIGITFLLLGSISQADNVNQNNELSFTIPKFGSLTEEKAWEAKNQKEIDNIYTSIIKRISENNFAKDVIVTADDTPESIDKKYNNAQTLIDTYNKTLNGFQSEYINLLNRCSEQECSNKRLQEDAVGFSLQHTEEYKSEYIAVSLCSNSESNGDKSVLYLTSSDDATGEVSTYMCASKSLFRNIKFVDKLAQMEGYKSYLKGAYSNISILHEKLQEEQLQAQQKKLKAQEEREEAIAQENEEKAWREKQDKISLKREQEEQLLQKSAEKKHQAKLKSKY